MTNPLIERLRDAVTAAVKATARRAELRSALGSGREEVEAHGALAEAIKAVGAALAAQPPAPAAPSARTLLEQYDLDQSPEYRKGYEDGRLKGYEIGHRHASKPAPAAQEPLTKAEVDAIWDGLMPSGCGKSRYDIARGFEAARAKP